MANSRGFSTAGPVLPIIGLTSTAFLTGKLFSQSWSTVPALLHSPAPLLAKQWRAMFHSDIYLAPLVTAFSSGIFAYLASKLPKYSRPQLLYLSAVTFLLSLIPYSAVFLEPINRMLEQRAKTLRQRSIDSQDALERGFGKLESTTGFSETAEPDMTSVDAAWEKQTVHVLVDRWALINAGRTALAGLATGLAGWATVTV